MTHCHQDRPATTVGALCGCFADTRVWIFDLDNTLYPAECDLFAQVADKMNRYIETMFGIDTDAAKKMRRDYYLEYGTTLAGLMRLHSVDPDHFLAFVHDIDHSPLQRNEALAAAIAQLPGRRFIFTNGSTAHAEAVAGKVGVLDLFEGIFDIRDANYIPKPHRATFDGFLGKFGLASADAAMFEDLPHNLETAHDLGMTTVLVHSSYDDHPSQADARALPAPPPHIHHATDDLAGFLAQLDLAR